MTAVFSDPFAQLQAINDAIAELNALRGLAVDALADLDREGVELADLAAQIDAAIVTVKGMTE